MGGLFDSVKKFAGDVQQNVIKTAGDVQQSAIDWGGNVQQDIIGGAEPIVKMSGDAGQKVKDWAGDVQQSIIEQGGNVQQEIIKQWGEKVETNPVVDFVQKNNVVSMITNPDESTVIKTVKDTAGDVQQSILDGYDQVAKWGGKNWPILAAAGGAILLLLLKS